MTNEEKIMVKKVLFRLYQKVMYILAFLISFREPRVIKGKDTCMEIPVIIKNHKLKKVFVVTDDFLSKTSYFKTLVNKIESEGISVLVFNKTKPNPSIKLIEEAYDEYKKFSAEAIIAYGGGSPMDLAKIVGARVARPNKSVVKMKGTLKVLKKIPLLIAVPTTVGTGSEATLAAVVSKKDTFEKFAIMDSALIPRYAILDVNTVIDLPKNLIATTGMDALTHAVEAYIGKANTKKTKKNAIEAVDLIFSNLENAYYQDQEALENMQLAAYKAGVAFTRAYVGNVHALAHTLSGFYDYPHGLANAIILPYVLDFYGSRIEKKLKDLEKVVTSKTNNIDVLGNTFLDRLRGLQRRIGIPNTLNGLIKEKDFTLMAERAYQEANPLYPVPVIMEKSEFLELLRKIN